MANVILKSLKFTRILSGRLSLISLKHYHGKHLIRSYSNTRETKAYATAAYKLAPSEDSVVKNSDTKSNIIIKDLDSIDAALFRIDTIIRRNGRTQLKNIHQIFSAITSKEITTSVHGLYLMRSCKYCCDEPPSKRVDLVNQIWNRYQELGIEFDVRHYNALLDAHVSSGLDFNPAEILASMEDLNIEPNKATYMLIMKKFCQDGNISGASEILEHMKENKMSVDENVFNYLIEGHIKNNDIAGAKEMVEVMRSSNLEPTVDTHTILACGYAALGDKNEMMTHLKECKQQDSAQSYLKVIDVLAGSGNHQHVDDVLSLIQHRERYQQEFINSAVELIHKDFDDVAYKLATASCSPEYNEGIGIFVKQLIKVGKPLSEVLHFCECIYNGSFSQNIYLVASRASAEHGLLNCTVALFKKMQELGHYLRPNNFWPLFTHVKEEKSSEGCWLILKEMHELGVPCDFTTYTDIVLPALGVPRPDDVLREVKRIGQTVETAADALFIYYCDLAKLDYADHLTQIYPVKVSKMLDVSSFVNLDQNINTESRPIYLKLLRFMFMDGDFLDNSDVRGRLLAELIIKRIKLLENLLNKYEDLKFSERTFSVCEQEVMERNPGRHTYFKKLRLLSSERENIFKQENISIEDEKSYIYHLKAQNISCRPFLTKRLQHHFRMKDVTRVCELMSIFDELKLDYSPLILSNLIEMWSAAGDLQKAQEAFEKLTTNCPNFKLDLPKSLDYVTLLVKYEKFDESYEALKNFLTDTPYIYFDKDDVLRSSKRLGIMLSNTQNIEYVKKMQSLLMPLCKELGSKKTFLDPLVNLHLQRNDLTSAFADFRNIVMTHHVPTCLNYFLKKCINAGEKDILQKVIDLTTSCAGKSYALLELAVAFIETSNTQSAVKVIESLGHETDPKVLEDICSKLAQQSKLSELEQLIFITKSISHVNRENLYRHAFKVCANRSDFQRALKLFDSLKEEVVEPESETVTFLQNLLKENNQTIPLSLISKSQLETNSLTAEATKTFIEHLNAGDAEAALKELSGLKKGYVRTLSISTLTDLVDLCLLKDCVYDLSLIVHPMTYIIDNAKDILQPILEKYSEVGDVEKFIAISSFMPDFSLMGINFNTYFCKAFISCGKYENLLSQLEQRTDKKNKLFSMSAFEALLKHPELEDRIFNLAVKYYDSNYNLPIAVVWAHYFSKENYEKADEILKNFSFGLHKVDSFILKKIKKNENIALAKKYVDLIKLANVRSRVKEKAYGTALDLLVFKGLYDEAVDLMVESEKQNLHLHKYYLSTLVTLKNVLEKENKPVPFRIPLDEVSGSSSDSE